ncbi:carbonic anhydrase/acetyltransferase-like protein (isoleucine patch superfamily) [Methanohalophilus levihalophilus]|uniref:DapH/DapD/GlmU-related protein n=1 Tax=Methanohalophilus levihalophilus TaxID=1431282 RepID=UPI001AE4C326|nr:DapH/DapD/GlmU-related protein [Methanohalophilus levihalophilus]MBP2029479.1 carbonic anhydrase/acetyltransferase-like protein (isoleucine patch superfamily) [Methanohalophilus levihalophilus]
MQNPAGQHPEISESAWISDKATIIGNVYIGNEVFVGPNAVIRADEPDASIRIEDNCNVQDNVTIHGISGSEVVIGKETSLAHGCIVHGPCTIGKGCFIGFGAVVFDCKIGDDVVILHNTTVHGVTIESGRNVPIGAVIVTEKEAARLPELTCDLSEFKQNVIEANLELVEGYRNTKC